MLGALRIHAKDDSYENTRQTVQKAIAANEKNRVKELPSKAPVKRSTRPALPLNPRNKSIPVRLGLWHIRTRFIEVGSIFKNVRLSSCSIVLFEIRLNDLGILGTTS